MHTERLAFLFDRFLTDNLSPEETEELHTYLRREGHSEHVHAILAAMIDREAGQDGIINREGSDAGYSKAGDFDAGYSNGGYSDAGDFEAGYSDGGYSDGGYSDGGYSDARYSKAGDSDAGDSDAGDLNAGYFDGGYSDAGHVEAGYSEAGYSEAGYSEARFDPMVDRILSRRGRILQLVRRSAVAAAILLLAGGVSWWGLQRSVIERPQPTAHQKPTQIQDIPPGGNKATLTLGDNTTIDLNEAADGLLSRQGDQQVVKQKDGQLAYRPDGTGGGLADGGGAARNGGANATGASAAGAEVANGLKKTKTSGTAITYNLLATPRGGQYQLTLPDGTKVWLNAASSLRYPTSFVGDQRLVELTGEAYFEVAANAKMPFRVAVAGRRGEPVKIDVLGTSFNIKAYADEAVVNTTLLTGSVRVLGGGKSAMVRPGEQAVCKDGDAIRVGVADIEEAVAWKNGLFKFNGAPTEDVMRQLSRWYDVDVRYENGGKQELFQGEMYRNVTVSKVLKILEASGVHFTVEGKTIVVK